MPLCIPVVAGPINELMTGVQVIGAVPGATLIVTAEGPSPRDLGKVVASGGSDWVPLHPGELLRYTDVVVASQSLGAESSPPTPAQLAVAVSPAPQSSADVGHIGTSTHLYRCGQGLWLTGVIPGATAEVAWGGTVRAIGVAGNDGVRLQVPAGLPPGAISLRQVTPVGAGPAAIVRTDDAPRVGNRLPTPVVGAPLRECQGAVLVSNVVDGATVTLHHRDGSTNSAVFDRSALWFGVPSLVEGDEIVASQHLQQCEIDSAASAPPVPVGSKAALPAPSVIGPLCAGAVSIRVAGIVPGASIIVNANGASYRAMPPPNAAFADIFVAPLTGGTVSAAQELCGVTSAQSAAVAVASNGPVTSPVKLTEPLMECARAVGITNGHPGAIVQVWARSANGDAPISGLIVVNSTEMTIGVTPYLRQGDFIRVVQYGCSATAVWSGEAEVKPHSEVGRPTISTPLHAGSTSVQVRQVVPGALVDVYARQPGGTTWQLVGSTIAISDPQSVPISGPLEIGTALSAIQSLCGVMTEPGDAVTATMPPPQVPVITAPANGATGVARRPTVAWNDPGNSSYGPAATYDVELKDGSTQLISAPGLNSRSFTPGSDLPYSRKVTARVRARNTGGVSGWAEVSFTTIPEPPPPPPTLIAYDVTTLTLTGKGFKPSATVYVRLSMFVGNSVINSYGVAVADTRIGWMTTTAQPDGTIKAVVNPKTVLPALWLDDVVGYWLGAFPGEVMNFGAHDGRPNPSDITGVLWSNGLNITVP